MTVRSFVDTNVLIYAASPKSLQPTKAPIALSLLASEDLGLSAQVLQEFYDNVTRRARVPISLAEAMAWIERLTVFPCASIDAGLVKHAIALSQRWRIAYWDAAILAAAERLQAEVVYTEDLNHGQTYGSVRVVNPFL